MVLTTVREGAPGMECAGTRDAAQPPWGQGRARGRGGPTAAVPGQRPGPLSPPPSPLPAPRDKRAALLFSAVTGGRTWGQSALQPGLRPAPRSHVSPIPAGAIETAAAGDACRASRGPSVPRTLSLWRGAPGATLASAVPAKTSAWGWRWQHMVAHAGARGPGLPTRRTEPAWMEWEGGAGPVQLFMRSRREPGLPRTATTEVCTEQGGSWWKTHRAPGGGERAHELRGFKEDREGGTWKRDGGGVRGASSRSCRVCHPGVSCVLNSTLPHPQGQPRGKGQGQ